MTMRNIRHILPLFFLFFAESCISSETIKREKMLEVLSQYKMELKGALQTGMKKGASSAVQDCHIEAPQIAKILSEQGVRIGRSSHLLRNPGNTPPDWAAPILSEYLSDSSARSPIMVSLNNGRTGYVEPIHLQPICTACHGEYVSKEVSKKIAELYPDDQAVGFKVGDLRGIFWVEY